MCLPDFSHRKKRRKKKKDAQVQTRPSLPIPLLKPFYPVIVFPRCRLPSTPCLQKRMVGDFQEKDPVVAFVLFSHLSLMRVNFACAYCWRE
jgi:hypothetical protein